MRLYDTARREIVPFAPGAEVGLYVCGITPYDAAHLGHAFTYHVFDVLTRRLRAQGVTVRSVRNVTDVDDDILRVAKERGVDPGTLADSQVAIFDRDMADIEIAGVASPRASQHVPEMVEWITRLEHAEHAYAVDGWVYFDTQTYARYGQLSRIAAATMVTLSRERGANPDDARKRHPLDFVLWQPSAPGEPRWKSPWGEGRPGWHIECTVLAVGALGAPVDIHGGGDDLIYPHHESEIAQAESAGVTPYVRYWMHVAMVQLDGEKMSKSLGNLVFVRDLLTRSSAPAVRLMLAGHHYRASWTFDERELADAQSRLERYVQASAGGGMLEPEPVRELEARFWERLDDDLDTPGALHVLDEVAARLLSGGSATGSRGDVLTRLLETLGARVPTLTA